MIFMKTVSILVNSWIILIFVFQLQEGNADIFRRYVTGIVEAPVLATKYLKALRSDSKTHDKWGNEASLIAVGLYFADSNFFSPGNRTGEELALDLTTKLLEAHVRDQLEQLSSREIAQYIQASLVTCIDPHVISSLVTILRRRVEAEIYSNPLTLLTLCIANDAMTEKDVIKLERLGKVMHHSSWIGTQALGVMALSCISQKSNLTVDQNSIIDMVYKLKQTQFSSGRNDAMQTKALVAQAFIALRLGDKDTTMIVALKEIVKSQSSDGSFGNLRNTYYVLPVLKNESLLSISSDHCRWNHKEDDVSALGHLRNQPGDMIQVTYSLGCAEKMVVVRTLDIMAVPNSTFFDVMNLAANIDAAYRFSVHYRESKPYVYELSGIHDDLTSDKFWFLYKTDKVNNTTELIHSSPIDVIPADKDVFVMWFKTGDWAI